MAKTKQKETTEQINAPEFEHAIPLRRSKAGKLLGLDFAGGMFFILEKDGRKAISYVSGITINNIKKD